MNFQIGDIVKIKHESLQLDDNEAHILIMDIPTDDWGTKYLVLCMETGLSGHVFNDDILRIYQEKI